MFPMGNECHGQERADGDHLSTHQGEREGGEGLKEKDISHIRELQGETTKGQGEEGLWG